MLRWVSFRGVQIVFVALASVFWVGGAGAHDGALPKWALSSTCDAQTQKVTCRLLERIARYRIRKSWVSLPLASRVACVRDATSTSWRRLSECLNDHDDKAQIVCDARAEEVQCRIRVETAIKQYNADRSAAMNELVEERDTARSANRRLRKRLQNLFKVRDTYLDLAIKRQRTGDTLSEEYKTYRDKSELQINNHRQAEQQARTRRDELEAEIAELQISLRREQSRRVDLDDEIARLSALLKQDRETLSVTLAERDDLLNKSQDLEASVSEMNTERDRYKVLSDKRLTQYEALEDKHNDYVKSTEAQDIEITRLRDLLNTDRSRLTDLVEERGVLTTQLKTFKRREDRLVSSRDEFQALAIERIRTIDTLKADRIRDTKKIDEFTLEIDRLRKLLGEDRGRYTDLTKERDALAQSQKNLRVRQARIIASRDEYQLSVKRHNETIDSLEAARTRDADRMVAQRDEIERLRNLLKSERDGRSDLLSAQGSLKNTTRGLRQRVARLIKARDGYQEDAQTRRADLLALEASYKRAQMQILRLQREIQASADDERYLKSQCDKRVAACQIAQTKKVEAAATACEDAFADITRRGVILFPSSSSTITTSSFDTLDKLVDAIDRCRDFTVVVEGHTDSSGDQDDNLALSQDRAKSVVEYLTRKGVGLRQLESVGYGQDRPISENETAEGRRKNRRIQFTIKR